MHMNPCKMFKCDICVASFLTPHKLKTHIKTKHRTQLKELYTFECQHCEDKFSTPFELNKHNESKHEKGRKLNPETGGYTYEEYKEVVVSKSKQCPLCTKIFTTAKHMRVHLRSVHNGKERKFICDICGKQFTSNIHASRHKNYAHSRDRQKMECDYCKRKFTCKRYLAEHINAHTGNTIYGCRICKKTFLYTNGLRRHILSRHKDTDVVILNEVKDIFPSHLQSYQIKCRYCARTFSTQNDLKEHVSSVHMFMTESFENPNEPRVLNSNRYPLAIDGGLSLEEYQQIVATKSKQCPICEKIFAAPKQMRMHLRHVHSSIKRYMCDICGKQFTTLSYLDLHRKSHNETVKRKEEDKKYECDSCNKKFWSKRALSEHMIIHTGIKEHQCHVCNTAFYHIRSLSRHLKIHEYNESKMYKCPVCSKMFTELYEMKRHRDHKHGGKCHVCKICGATIKYNISRHMKTHTGEASEG